MDESNATCGKRLQSIGLENTEDSRRAYRELLVTTPGLGKYISGAILFEETLFQKVGRTSTHMAATRRLQLTLRLGQCMHMLWRAADYQWRTCC
jgi:fructose-bisphosphate aldolase class 1